MTEVIYVNWEEQEVYGEEEFKKIIESRAEDYALNSIDLNTYLEETYKDMLSLFNEFRINEAGEELYKAIEGNYSIWLYKRMLECPRDYDMDIEKWVLEI